MAAEDYKHLEDIIQEYVLTGGHFMGSQPTGYLPGAGGDQHQEHQDQAEDSALGRMIINYRRLEARVARLEAQVFPRQRKRHQMEMGKWR